MENFNSQLTSEKQQPTNGEWDDIEKDMQYLPLWSEVPNLKGYKISSLPFDSKKEAYEEIENYYKGEEDTTTYYSGGKWYIIQK